MGVGSKSQLGYRLDEKDKNWTSFISNFQPEYKGRKELGFQTWKNTEFEKGNDFLEIAVKRYLIITDWPGGKKRNKMFQVKFVIKENISPEKVRNRKFLWITL